MVSGGWAERRGEPVVSSGEVVDGRAEGDPPRASGADGRRQRRKRRWMLPVLVVLFACVGGCSYLGYRLSSIERVTLGAAVGEHDNGVTNYLLVGSDSRASVERSSPNAGAFLAEEVEGARADAIVLVQRRHGSACVVSIPRDLWLAGRTGQEPGRLGLRFGDGPEGPSRLVKGVNEALGVPVHHYLEVDFAAVRGLVNSLGGLRLDFDVPARDDWSGFEVTEAGPQVLDGDAAVAYLRSRNLERFIEGRWELEEPGDGARTQRHVAVFEQLLRQLGQERRPWVLHEVLVAAGADGLRVDGRLGNLDLVALARWLSAAEVSNATLPVRPGGERGGVPVVELDVAEPLLEQGTCLQLGDAD